MHFHSTHRTNIYNLNQLSYAIYIIQFTQSQSFLNYSHRFYILVKLSIGIIRQISQYVTVTSNHSAVHNVRIQWITRCIKVQQPYTSLHSIRCKSPYGHVLLLFLTHLYELLWQYGIVGACSGPFVQSTGVTSSCEETSSFCWEGCRKMEQEKIGSMACLCL